MEVSSKTKRIFIIAVAVIVLALAASEGTKPPENSRTVSAGVPYPHVPLELDQKALEKEDETAPVQKKIVAKPRPLVSAESYLVANLETREIYNEFKTRRVFPIASISKLITATVALHNMRTDQVIEITPSMLEAYGDAGRLSVGEKYTVGELLYPLLLESSNDAAEAIAESYGYDSFIQKMNEFVAGLGMKSTSFKDASGLSAGNVSSAHDLLILAKYIYANEKELLTISRQTKYVLASTTDHVAQTWKTINPFPFDPHFLGGKTGRTNEAKESMMSLFRYSNAGYSYPVAIIVLRSDFTVREEDSSYLFGQFVEKVEKTISIKAVDS